MLSIPKGTQCVLASGHVRKSYIAYVERTPLSGLLDFGWALHLWALASFWDLSCLELVGLRILFVGLNWYDLGLFGNWGPLLCFGPRSVKPIMGKVNGPLS